MEAVVSDCHQGLTDFGKNFMAIDMKHIRNQYLDKRLQDELTAFLPIKAKVSLVQKQCKRIVAMHKVPE